MDKFDRIYKLHQVFSSRRYPVAMPQLCSALECSTPTVKRLIREMREYLDAPIVTKRGSGYFYDKNRYFELPGLWFNRHELEALLIMNQLLFHVGPGLLEEELAPVRRRLDRLLEKLSPQAAGEVRRIRILDMAGRRASLSHFPLVAGAVLERTRLEFDYHSRSRDESARREVSPQRLTRYRDNWYLDAWCHARKALRTFSLERMSRAARQQRKAKHVPETRLDLELGSAYGIFSGKANKIAVLRFTPERARWVAEETWHPKQKGAWLPDGCYELRLPYGNATELVLDICRYGPDVEVVQPAGLRQAVADCLRLAAAQYG